MFMISLFLKILKRNLPVFVLGVSLLRMVGCSKTMYGPAISSGYLLFRSLPERMFVFGHV